MIKIVKHSFHYISLDVDECTFGVCGHRDNTCNNQAGSYNCSCADGYDLQNAGQSTETCSGKICQCVG